MRRMNSGRTKAKAVGLAAMLGFVSLIFVVICVEVVTRVVFPHGFVLLDVIESTPDARSYALKPNSKASHVGLYDEFPVPVRWEVNGEGMRSDRVLSRQTDKFRVMTFGDSEAFGWSVQLEDTMQRQMEAIDSDVEVLNLGVPGYNAANVADYMEMTIEEYDPDAVVYVFNPNDADAALTVSPLLSKSVSYLLARYSLYVSSGKHGEGWQASLEAREIVAGQLTRMMDICERQQVPFIVLVLGWEHSAAFPFEWQEGLGESVTVIDAQGMFHSSNRKDRHLAEPAHRRLADLLCSALSGVVGNACRP